LVADTSIKKDFPEQISDANGCKAIQLNAWKEDLGERPDWAALGSEAAAGDVTLGLLSHGMTLCQTSSCEMRSVGVCDHRQLADPGQGLWLSSNKTILLNKPYPSQELVERSDVWALASAGEMTLREMNAPLA